MTARKGAQGCAPILLHKHGGTIQRVLGIGHETYKGVAEWYFIAEVQWPDAQAVKTLHVSPIMLCYKTEEQRLYINELTRQLTDYLDRAGTWHDFKHKRDGRVYSWTPHERTGEEKLDG